MQWIDAQPDFDAAMQHIGAQPIIAVDTEADSLHSYFDKVCLIQITADDDFVIDPLRSIDLKRFGEVLADSDIVKVLHGGDYDVRILNRDFGFTVSHLIDTSVCAQLLGYEAIGLAALLDRHFGLKLNKTHQRADWSMRPLTPEMLDYAATDTRHLIPLAAILRKELEDLGRWEWALEEFTRLEAVRYRETTEEDGEPFRRLKGIGGYDRRALAVVRGLHEWRDSLARKADRPPFKILGNDAIIELGKEQPRTREELARVKVLPRFHQQRYGSELLRIIREALELPEEKLPERGETKPWIRDKALEARVERLKKVRDRFAKELKIDGSVLAPRHVLTAVATMQPAEVSQLDAIPAMRNWQKRVIGPALIEALASNVEKTGKLF